MPGWCWHDTCESLLNVSDTTTEAELRVLPTSHVSSVDDGWKIKSYICDTPSPEAAILYRDTVIGNSTIAPVMACFTSGGPSVSDPNILKPDIIGPGVNVLSASPFRHGKPSSKFFFMSGTSHVTPHLSASSQRGFCLRQHISLVTCCDQISNHDDHLQNCQQEVPIMDNDMLNPADYFPMDASEVDQTAANNPGLIYDHTHEDYIP